MRSTGLRIGTPARGQGGALRTRILPRAPGLAFFDPAQPLFSPAGPVSLGKSGNSGTHAMWQGTVPAVRDGPSFEGPINSTKAQNNAGLIL